MVLKKTIIYWIKQLVIYILVMYTSNALDPNTIFSPSSMLSEKVWLVIFAMFFSVQFRFARLFF